jgi:hypothetical protein
MHCDFFMAELRRRESSRREHRMVVLTWAMAGMTAAIAGLTVASLIAVFAK